MKKMCSIINVNLKNNLQSLSLVIVYLGIALICTVVIGIIGVRSFILPAIRTGKANSEAIGYIIGILGYITAILVTGICYSTLFSNSLIREKINGNIESLLGTSTSVKTVWIAKSIALFIPGFLMGTIFTLGLTEFINVAYVSPNFQLHLNPYVTISTYIIVPITYFCLSLLMNLVGLIGRAMDGGVIGIIFVSGVVTVMINLVARNTINGHSWPFIVVNLALACILMILCIIFKNKLNAERIVLSCRK